MRFPLWSRKLFVAFIAVITLGTVIPTEYLQDLKPAQKTEANYQKDVSHVVETDEPPQLSYEEVESEPLRWPEIAERSSSSEVVEEFITYASLQTEELGIRKFGDTIANRVGSEYINLIVPKVSEVITSKVEELDVDFVRSLRLTDKPSGGYGERIMHVYNEKTGNDLMRFHVRRDHPPQDGYWFNFHYHDEKDNFSEHHEVGKIYWDKNTPPKWLS
ncbi:YpjP family protein [Alkalihalobacillus sp. CinArs1]|uniref:YpjP family protein n=1 Tax=Alkalihalobacillus sp. CinArs1 TaxID=2995314 RepID=UPI0022DD9004|nr:YpjP family protein [Alkalihalobacillus sp. CinArs1]